MELHPAAFLCAAPASFKHVGEQRKTGYFLQNPVQGERDIRGGEGGRDRKLKLQTELAY